jgi:hypothetical protein
MDQTSILIGVVSNLIVVFIVWAISISIKSYIKQIVDNSLSSIDVKIAKIKTIADDNYSSNQQIKIKIMELNRDMELLRKQLKIMKVCNENIS